MRARHALPLAFLGLWVAACGGSAAPLAPFPASSAPAVSPTASALRPSAAATSAAGAVTASPQPAASGVEASAGGASAVGEAPPVAPATLPQLLLLEPPYSALGHARLGTEMQTLGRDEELFQWALGGSSDPAHPSNRPGYHPATRVVVDVELLSRAPKGSTARLLRIARSTGYWPLRGCFEAAQRLAAKSARSARVRLTLGATGKVLGSRSLGPAPERDYARCVLERVRSLDFAPGFTRRLDVEISVKQWPGHAPVPPRAPDGTPSVRVSATDSATLEGLSPKLLACYAPAFAADPKLWGRIALKLTLDGDGAISEAAPVETRFPNPEVVECARQAVLGARLESVGVKELTFAVRLGQSAPPVPVPPELSPAAAPPVPESAPPAPPAPPAPVH